MLQEPYIGATGTMNVQYKTIQMQTNRDAPVKAAVVLLDPSVRVIESSEWVTQNEAGVIIEWGGMRIGIISIYWEEYVGIDEQIRKLDTILTRMDTVYTIVGGDCNAKSPWWGHEAEDERGESYASYLNQRNLEILNEGVTPTFYAIRRNIEYKSIVDITVCSQELHHKIQNWRVDVDLVTTSDHRAITFDLLRGRLQDTDINKRTSTRIYNTKKADWMRFKLKLDEVLTETDVTNESINKCNTPEDLNKKVEEYTCCIRKACDDTIPQIQPFTTKKIKWWNKELTALKMNVKRLRRKIKKANPCRKPYVIEEYKASLEEYKDAILNARTESWREFCTGQERESVWDRIYRVMKYSGKTTQELLLKKEGKELSPQESAKELARTFYPKDDLEEDTSYHTETRNWVKEKIEQLNRQVDYIPITLDEIHNVLRSISPKKAPGEDGLTADICYNAFQSVPLIFQSLLNKCLQLGYFPRTWKRAIIKVLRKPGKADYTTPKSYRPIGLLPVNGKILEKIVCSRILWSLGQEGKLSRRQYGFTPQRSTEDALYDAITMIRGEVERKRIIAVASLDIEGAFDNAWWPGILKQLIMKECDPYLLKLMRSYLGERQIQLTYAGCDAICDTSRGCIQGSTGGPLMWNIQLDPLLEEADNIDAHVQAFADDILIVASADNIEELNRKINTSLDMITTWGLKNKMRFAAHKTQVAIFTKRQKYKAPQFVFNGATLQLANAVTVLGVTIDAGLTFREHLDKTTNKALNIYKAVSKAARATWGLNSEIIRTLYIAVVEPTILYAASVWEPVVKKKYARKKLDKITRMFAIKICKAHRTVSLNAGVVLGSILPLDLRATENAELYRCKRGASIPGLPGRDLERLASVFDLPHPAKRKTMELSHITTTEDLEGLPRNIIKFFTDGSKIEGKVGAAVSCWREDQEISYSTIRLADYCSVFQAEMAAIKRAAEMALVKHKKEKDISIISDSRSALQIIVDGQHRHPLAIKIRDLIQELEARGTHVTLYWIKAHEGLSGNERADELAKNAALYKKTAPVYDSVPVTTVKWLLREKTVKEWQSRYTEEDTGAKTKLFFPDVRIAHKILKDIKMDNKLCQLFTGHGGFGEYLHRFNLKASPFCECDGVSPESIIHLLCDCPRFLADRTSLESATGISVTQNGLYEFLNSTKIRKKFLEFSLKIVNKANVDNKSKIVL